MTDLDPQDPADALPRGARAARTTGRPAPLVPPRGAGGKTSRPGEFLPGTPGRDPSSPAASTELALFTAAGPTSPQRSERAGAPETPDPSTGAAPDRAAAPVRVRAKTPAGSAPGSSALSAGQMAIARAMSEDRGPDSLDAHVRRLMRDLGLRGFHAHDARRSEKGYPDWTIAGAGGQIWRELKTQRGRLTREQQEWLGLLRSGGGDAAVWRPEHLLSGQVARELAVLAIPALRAAIAEAGAVS